MSLIPIDAILEGDRLALSRLLSQIENRTAAGENALEMLFHHTGKAFLVGITGAPGTGKSTLVNRLAYHFRHQTSFSSPRVAVIAVDPSSPFSGGAVLGDRVRMRDLSGDPGVFIRSMASRGSLGGLAETTSGLVQAFDAAGYRIIIIETVGAGQAEVEIARLAHTTTVIEAPGMGDEIQTIKAGILEIADILVINKADKPEAEISRRMLTNMLRNTPATPEEIGHHSAIAEGMSSSQKQETQERVRWEIPIMMTTATSGEGVVELGEMIFKHHHYLKASGEWIDREKKRLKHDLDQRLQSTLVNQWRASIAPDHYQNILTDLVEREISPSQAVHQLVKDVKK